MGTFAAMMGKGTKLYSIFRVKCPHCHEGEFFVDRNPYNLKHVGDVLEKCPVCERKYTPEPGFYYGGMYVSYALTVALFATIYVATIVLAPDAPLWVPVTLVISGLLITAPFIYALSKIIWANLFMKYKGVDLLANELEGKAPASSPE